MIINNNDMYNLLQSSHISLGGIGSIYKYNKYAYKITFNLIAFINNINAYYKLKYANIPCVRLHSFGTVNVDEYECRNAHACDLEKLYIKCPQVFDRNIYILKYDKHDGNAYSLFQTIKSLDDIIFLKIWTYLTIYKMNSCNIFHNDLKLDNILIKRNIPNNNNIHIGNIIICNRSNWSYCLNDFDLLSNQSIISDIKTVCNSMYNLNILNEEELKIIEFGSNILENLIGYWFTISDHARSLIYVTII